MGWRQGTYLVRRSKLEHRRCLGCRRRLVGPGDRCVGCLAELRARRTRRRR